MSTRPLAIVALLFPLPLVEAAPVPKTPAFEAKSIEFVDGDGKNQTLDFNQNGIAQPPAVAARSDIFIRGTVTPATTKVSGKLLVGQKEYDIKVESERWEVRIPAGDCKRATNYKIRAVEDEVVVNGKAVPVAEKQLSIAND